MKNLIRLGLILVSAGASGIAAPFMAIGDGAELFVTGSLGVRADDNIFLTATETSDLIFDLTPGVELVFGRKSQLQGSLTLADTFSNYSDHHDLNTNLFVGVFGSKYDDGKLKLGFNTSFRELNQNSVDVRPPAGAGGGFVRRDIFAAALNAEVEISQITSVAAGLDFGHENFKRSGYTDSDSLTVPLTAFYKWTPKTDLSVGYRYRDYRVDLGSDSTDHFFSVGARGEFTPKLAGKFAVGLNTRRLEIGGSENQLGLLADLTYEITAKSSLSFGASNDFGTGARGEQQKNTILNLMGTSRISAEWSVQAGVLWRAIDFGTRTDEYYETQLGTTYIVNATTRIVGSFIHRDSASDLRVNEFKNNVFNLAAQFRY